MYRGYEAFMDCGCIVYYNYYEDGCCKICASTEVDILSIDYCDTHSG